MSNIVRTGDSESNLPAVVNQPKLPIVFAQVATSNNRITIVIGGVGTYERTENIQELLKLCQEYRAQKTQARLDLIYKALKLNQDGLSIILGDNFTEVNGKIYLKGTNVALPEFMKKQLLDAYEKSWPIKPIENFWINCLLNPNSKARNELFEYCNKYGIPITDIGYAVMYKAVTHIDRSKQLTEGKYQVKLLDDSFKKDLPREIGLAVERAKKAKKGIAKYTLFKNQEGEFRSSISEDPKEGETVVGNLKELFERLEEFSRDSEIVYTDKHSKTMEIRLGVPVRMGRNKCDESTRLQCSNGLHVGAMDYVHKYGGYGDTILMVLVNPKDVIAVNINDWHGSKIRVCQYIPVAIMEDGENKGEWTQLESGYTDLDYAEYEIRELLEMSSRQLSESEETARQLRSSTLERVAQGDDTVLLDYQDVEEGEDEVTHEV